MGVLQRMFYSCSCTLGRADGVFRRVFLGNLLTGGSAGNNTTGPRRIGRGSWAVFTTIVRISGRSGQPRWGSYWTWDARLTRLSFYGCYTFRTFCCSQAGRDPESAAFC